jgi:thiosulfate/3-mercaptopyruvate sulfurtransferase
LGKRLGGDDLVVVDCRFNLMDAAAGRKSWVESHIPGAFYADLDAELASPRRPDSGRHPLPDPQALAALLGSWGLTPEKLLVVYDAVGGAVAGRLWWLLRWVGHENVALLDGGLPAWKEAGQPVDAEIPVLGSGIYPVTPGSMPEIASTDVQSRLEQGRLLLVDARDAKRFAGEVEPIDAKAGHIPGSLNRPFQNNLVAGGKFKPAAELRKEFGELLNGSPEQSLAFSCGSGVTACHNLFALELAGIERPASLYVGSWSEWIVASERPVVTQ